MSATTLLYRRRPQLVHAAQAITEFPEGICFCLVRSKPHVHTVSQGPVEVGPGDWVVLSEDGREVLSDERFRALYEEEAVPQPPNSAEDEPAPRRRK